MFTSFKFSPLINSIKTNILTIVLLLTTFFLNFYNTPHNPKAILITFITTSICLFLLHKKQKTFNLSSLSISLIIYITASLLSFYFSSTPNLGLAELTSDINLIVLLIILGQLFIKSPNTNLHLIFKSNIIIQFCFSLYQIFHSTHPRNFGTFFNHFESQQVFPNALALSLITSMLFIFPNKKSTLNNYIFIFLGLITLFFSYSRGATLSFIIPTIIYVAINLFQKNYKTTLKVLSIITLSVLGFTFLSNLKSNAPSLQDKLNFANNEQTTSIQERLNFFKGSLQLFSQKPILGYGPNSFSYTYPSVQEIPLSNSLHPHNLFFKILSERGSIAIIPALVFLFILFYYINKQNLLLKHSPEILTLTAISLHSLIDYNLNFTLNSFLLIIILSSILAKLPTSSKKLPNYTLIILPLIFTSYFTLIHFTYQKGDNHILKLNQINYENSFIKLIDQSPKKEETLKLIESQKNKNLYNSFLFNKIGHTYLELNMPDLAIQNFWQSITADPKNFWNPYNYLTQTINQYYPKQITQYENFIIQQLSEYSQVAQLNLHYTSQSDNIDQAIQTTKNLSQNPNLTSQNQENLTQILNDLTQAKKTFSSN